MRANCAARFTFTFFIFTLFCRRVGGEEVWAEIWAQAGAKTRRQRHKPLDLTGVWNKWRRRPDGLGVALNRLNRSQQHDLLDLPPLRRALRNAKTRDTSPRSLPITHDPTIGIPVDRRKPQLPQRDLLDLLSTELQSHTSVLSTAATRGWLPNAAWLFLSPTHASTHGFDGFSFTSWPCS